MHGKRIEIYLKQPRNFPCILANLSVGIFGNLIMVTWELWRTMDEDLCYETVVSKCKSCL